MGVFTHMELGQSTHSAKSFVCPPYLSGKGQLLKLSPRSVRADTSQSSAVLHSPAQLNRMIPMPISNSCLSEQGKCPRNPLIALPDWPNVAIYRLYAITFKPRSYPSSIDEGTTVVIICGMNFCNFELSPRYSQKSDMMVDIESISAQWDCQQYSVLIDRGHNSQNWLSSNFFVSLLWHFIICL